MARKEISLNGALVGGLGGWVAEVAIGEITGHHITTGFLEILGAAAGLWRLDRRLARTLKESLAQAQEGPENDYRQVKQRIEELTRDLPELREILDSLVDAGIAAQRA
jgi:hypothetical protein